MVGRGSANGFRLIYPTGAQDVYEQAWAYTAELPERYSAVFYFITQQAAPNGRATSFIYTNVFPTAIAAVICLNKMLWHFTKGADIKGS